MLSKEVTKKQTNKQKQKTKNTLHHLYEMSRAGKIK